MTQTEFEDWYQDYCRTFPGVATWLNSLDVSNPGVKAHQKRTWCAVLALTDLRDAKAATYRIAAGDEPAIPAYERELTGATIRGIAVGIAWERNQRAIDADRKRETPARRGDDGISCGAILREASRLRSEGATDEEVKVFINSQFPLADERSGRRYRCRTCLDTRVVYVWSGRSIQAALDGNIEDNRRARKACVADCCCAREAREKVLSDKQRAKFIYYDETKHCACPRGDVDDPANIAALQEWCAAATSIQARENFSPEFEEYNREAERRTCFNP